MRLRIRGHWWLALFLLWLLACAAAGFASSPHAEVMLPAERGPETQVRAGGTEGLPALTALGLIGGLAFLPRPSCAADLALLAVFGGVGYAVGWWMRFILAGSGDVLDVFGTGVLVGALIAMASPAFVIAVGVGAFPVQLWWWARGAFARN